MKKFHIYRAVLATITVLAVWGVYEACRIGELKTQIENNYNRAFHELVGYVDDMDTLLQKSMLISSPAQMASLSGELFRQASAAKACLGQLPISEVQLENTEKFLSQVGDYTYYLSQNVINSGAVNDSDYDSLNSLSEYAGVLNQSLASMQNDVYDGLISFSTIKNEGKSHLTTTASADGGILSDLESVEKEFQEYPSLIYDGPFSEHIEKIRPIMTDGTQTISAEDALKKARDFIGEKNAELEYTGESQNSRFDAYSFSHNTESAQTHIAVTKAGGYPVYFIKQREIGKESLDINTATEAAREFLYSRGFTSLKNSYYEKSGGVATINFAYEQGGIICYSDLIKVKVALDNGEIVGCELHGYLMNHQYRTINTPTLSIDEAHSKINSHLEVKNTALALIPKDGQTEKLCYEFTGSHNGRNFIIYINAQNGHEEEILMLIESENGVLTV